VGGLDLSLILAAAAVRFHITDLPSISEHHATQIALRRSNVSMSSCLPRQNN